MKAKDIIKWSAGTLAVIIAAVIITPSFKLGSIAEGTSTATTFHGVVYVEGTDEDACETKSDNNYQVKSSGIMNVDYENDGTIDISADSSDYNKLAYLMNNLNTITKTGFDKAVKYRAKVKKTFSKLGFDNTVATSRPSGYMLDSEKTQRMLNETETVKSKIGY